MMNFVEELRWRGMLHDIMPETEEMLLKESTAGYIGFDPTGESLHIGSLVQIIILMHFQKSGHTPVALVGGATGMIGDPSGKSAERNLLNEETLAKNIAGIRSQLERFIDFNSDIANKAELVNNYDWMKDYSFIDFARDIGKHITVNYMMSKESVKKRLGAESKVGMSFTEFTYQLFQGYDFLHLYREKNCKIQMGGSDQWGNITTGTELVRRVAKGKAYAMTCPLITKADGTKFGKTEGGNIWLDRHRTSPYKFYQYWLNASDEDAEKYIKIFTFLDKETVEALITEHKEDPGRKILQKRVAEEVTTMVHSKEDLQFAIDASKLLFDKKSTKESFEKYNNETLQDIFQGLDTAEVTREDIDNGLDMIGALAAKTGFLKSNGDARRALKENAISVNKEKVKEDFSITAADLINDKFILLQRGKKNYYVIVVK